VVSARCDDCGRSSNRTTNETFLIWWIKTSLFSILNTGLHILQTVKRFPYLLALVFIYCRSKLPLRSQLHYQNHFKSQSLMS